MGQIYVKEHIRNGARIKAYRRNTSKKAKAKNLIDRLGHKSSLEVHMYGASTKKAKLLDRQFRKAVKIFNSL